MQQVRSTTDPKYQAATRSDAALIAGIRRQEQRALGILFDRYAPLVFTLAQGACPDSAEAITEGVFYELWASRGGVMRAGSLLHTLIDLTELAVGQDGARSPTKLLAPFEGLSPLVYDVMVLTYVGQVDIQELSAALDVDKVRVREALVAGIRVLRRSRPPTSLAL